MYCFTNADTGMTMFDPFRFMLRQAYAEGTDLRMFVTPVHAVVRTLQQALELGERYEFWLKELVRINEEGPRAPAGRRCRCGISATPTRSRANRFPHPPR